MWIYSQLQYLQFDFEVDVTVNGKIINRDNFVYALSQWETLHRNVASHWLGAYTK